MNIFNRSLERLLPTSLKQFLSPVEDNRTPLPPELLDRIIDSLHDDRRALLALSLASKRTLVRSRAHLFTKLEFKYTDTAFEALVAKQKIARTRYFYTKLEIDDADRHFDDFLALLDAPWTSFALTTQSIHINGLFHRTRRHEYRPNKNIPLIAANLPNLKTLCLTSILWPCIPRHIADFFFELDLAHMQLDSVDFTMHPQNGFVELFRRLQPAIKSVTLYNLQFYDEEIPDLSKELSIFQLRMQFESLDTCSLLLLKDVWDPLRTKHLEVTVDSFHLRLIPMTIRDRELYTPFMSRFLQHVGPSLQRLFVKLSDPYFASEALPYYGSLDLSRCINVRSVHIGTITLDGISRSGEQMKPMLSAAWNVLSRLPSNSPSLEKVALTFDAVGQTSEGKVAELARFAWLDVVGRLQNMFPNLKVAVRFMYYAVDGEDFAPYVEALRHVPGMRHLEEKGVVSLEMVPWSSPWPHDRLPDQDA
ncbi:hypothetical protein GALMADRAFT_145126 [Galerina marginata CBS 339.88]|uniref:F-box domain-containing protein n=1 Tax=Galerina marginata (strain CBS 339.88) TaxID=685588 RepID=A0A067SJA8_GALM3|nr:hypothetical protein GALMADRAFT_145126 [Galerina marginata CBS 339.88]